MQQPDNIDKIRSIRNLPERYKKQENAKEILVIIKNGINSPKNTWPTKKTKEKLPNWVGAAVEMLKMLLRMNSIEQGIAPRLITDQKMLEKFCIMGKDDIEKSNIPFLHGWRYNIFGKDAENLISGELTLGFKDNKPLKFSNKTH